MTQHELSNLCSEDQAALDALLEAGFDPTAVADEHRERAARLAQMMGLLDHLPAPSPGDLLAERTIDMLAKARQKERYTQQIHTLTGSAGAPRMRLTELAAIAAMVIVSVSLIWPTLGRARDRATQYACQNKLAAAGMGFTSYAAANQGLMPAVKSRPGDPWWHLNQFDSHGNARSNTAHLFVLVRGGYVKPEDLACAGTPSSVKKVSLTLRDWPKAHYNSFSYQNQFTAKPHRLDRQMTIAILSDKNPLFTQGSFNRNLAPTAISRNHLSLGGQNVLMSSGEVKWLTAPMINETDNIWHAENKVDDLIQGQLINYLGSEAPAHENDSFLVP